MSCVGGAASARRLHFASRQTDGCRQQRICTRRASPVITATRQHKSDITLFTPLKRYARLIQVGARVCINNNQSDRDSSYGFRSRIVAIILTTHTCAPTHAYKICMERGICACTRAHTLASILILPVRMRSINVPTQYKAWLCGGLEKLDFNLINFLEVSPAFNKYNFLTPINSYFQYIFL